MAAGLIGGLLGAGLRGKLPQRNATRLAFGGGLLAIIVLMGTFLVTSEPDGYRATVVLTDTQSAPDREVTARVKIDPASAAEDANWVQITSWQGGGLHVDELKETGEGTYESTAPVPVHGDWKTLVRLHEGNSLLAIPIYLPEDTAIPAPEVPAERRFTREFVDETEILQRELKDDVPGWITIVAPLLVLFISLSFVFALAWGLARAAGGTGSGESRPPRERTLPVPSPGAAGS